jgi:hypothetical protein
MSVTRVSKRVPAGRVAELIISIHGDKALKDSDLAALFGISLSKLYARIGRKLWHFKPRAFHKLGKAHDRGRTDARAALAFTQAGVLVIAGIFGDDATLEAGMDIAHALKTRRRSSAKKKAPLRRAKDPAKTARYDEAKRRLVTARLQALSKKTRH